MISSLAYVLVLTIKFKIIHPPLPDFKSFLFVTAKEVLFGAFCSEKEEASCHVLCMLGGTASQVDTCGINCGWPNKVVILRAI